jgi:UPF0755 protein
MGRKVRVALALGAAFAVTLALGLIGWTWREFTTRGPSVSDITLVLPRGASLGAIANRLGQNGVLRHPQVFEIMVRALGEERLLKAGEYVFPARISPREIEFLLIAGHTVQRKLTVPEGLMATQILQLLGEAEGLSGDLPSRPPEGWLLPDTYYFAYGDERGHFVERMRQAMRDLLAQYWATRQPDLPYRSPDEAIVMASIIEKETAKDEERAKVASVYVNRLRRGMRLQADPTVAYGITGGGEALDRPLTRDDLAHDNPWNTYRVKGLPPTAIANPSRASVLAALHPEVTKYIYFVADGNGGHTFAESLPDHNRNVRKWRRGQRRR